VILLVACVIFLALSLIRSVFGAIAYFIILCSKLGDMYPALGAIRFELVAAVFVLATIPIGGGSYFRALPQRSRVNLGLLAFFAVGMLSVLQSVSFDVSWELGGYQLLKMALFYIMIVSSVRSERDLILLIWAFVLLEVWTAYEPIVNYSQGVVTEHSYGAIAYGRYGAATGHVALANTLCQGMGLTYFFLVGQSSRLKQLILGVFIFLLLTGVVVTKSRGGFVGIAAVALAIAYLSKRRVLALVVLAVGFVILIGVSGTDYVEHMATMQGGIFADSSTSNRWLGLVHGISMAIKRPILGVGLGAFAEARRAYFNYFFFSHNLYGEVIGELGLGSLIWFFWMYAIFKSSQKIKRALAAGAGSRSMFYFAIIGVQVSLYTRLVLGNFSHSLLIWFWFFMAGLTAGMEGLFVNRAAEPRRGIPEGEEAGADVAVTAPWSG
jgi:O-antigen ligase